MHGVKDCFDASKHHRQWAGIIANNTSSKMITIFLPWYDGIISNSEAFDGAYKEQDDSHNNRKHWNSEWNGWSYLGWEAEIIAVTDKYDPAKNWKLHMAFIKYIGDSIHLFCLYETGP